MPLLVARFFVHTVVANVGGNTSGTRSRVVPERYRKVDSMRLCQEGLGWQKIKVQVVGSLSVIAGDFARQLPTCRQNVIGDRESQVNGGNKAAQNTLINHANTWEIHV